ncbi:Uncharacterised protein [Legionella lansingensis]|uniref:Uncharacterized protein n=1 Tax=Legionella lansingensis TaxID=45067 RepID=A0A0W0VG12_9GAMM|nr:hypothetical protein [Legionella lansingensis]KTD19076.1 hypothetical protein Llan_2276 [Legionella lansingensis]SNV52100.1 Uncharacterised protein [Legionella lansingensis]
MFRIVTGLITGGYLRPAVTSRFIRGVSHFFSSKGWLWDALNIKHSWLKILPGKEPHSVEGTAALKKLITDETTNAENMSVTSLAKGKKVVGFSPAPGVADHTLVFDKMPSTPNFKTQVIPKITVKGSKLRDFELSEGIETCLSEKIDKESNAYLIHMRFLKPVNRHVEHASQEKLSDIFSYK